MKETEQAILNFIIDFISKKGWAPTTREICDACGYQSTSTVNAHLRSMIKKGLIESEIVGSGTFASRAIKVPGYKFVPVEDVKMRFLNKVEKAEASVYRCDSCKNFIMVPIFDQDCAYNFCPYCGGAIDHV